jgi:PAS domain S-box-containing protein
VTRKKDEEALKLSEEQFRRAIEDAPIPIIMQAEDGQVLQLSRTWTELTGYTINHIPDLDSWLTKAAYGEGASAVRDHMHALFEGHEESLNVEFPIRALDGSVRYWSFSASSPGKLRDGRRFIIGMAVDITEQEKAEEELKRRQAEIRTLFENTPAGLVLFDAKSPYTVLAHNKYYQQLFDEPFRSRGMVGLNIYQYAPEVEASGVKAVFDEVVRNKKPKSFLDFPYKSNPPNETWFNWYMAPIIVDDEVVALVSMSLDVTDRHKANVTLREAQAKLQQYSTSLEKLVEERTKQLRDAERMAAIGTTAGMVGHDIRNPLQAIVGDLYLAKSDLEAMPEGQEKEGLQESLAEIEKNVEYIDKIVEGLQDFAKTLKPVARETDLEEVCNEVLFKSEIEENVEASYEVQNEARKLVSDPDLLKRILSNLVSNAVQAMPSGGKLEIKAFPDADDLVVTVEDTGVGIPEDIRPQLFKPLFTTKSRGQGFGLAVVKRMTESLGGSVTFESEVGKGTKFVVRLPQKS